MRTGLFAAEMLQNFFTPKSKAQKAKKLIEKTERKVQASTEQIRDVKFRTNESRALISLKEEKASGQAKNVEIYKEEFDPGSG